MSDQTLTQLIITYPPKSPRKEDIFLVIYACLDIVLIAPWGKRDSKNDMYQIRCIRYASIKVDYSTGQKTSCFLRYVNVVLANHANTIIWDC